MNDPVPENKKRDIKIYFLVSFLLILTLFFTSFIYFQKRKIISKGKSNLNQTSGSENNNSAIGDISEKVPDIITKGVNWILDQKEAEFSGGSTFALSEFNKIYKSPEVEAIWKKNIKNDLGDRTYFYRLYDSSFNDNSIINTTGTDLMLVKALYCDKYPVDETINSINSIKKDKGFNTTHAILAILLMERQKCVGRELTKKHLDGLVADLTGSDCVLENNIDICAEKAAIITYAGYDAEKEWVDDLANLQNSDGSWPPLVGLEEGSVHTTSLALWFFSQKF